MPWMKFKKYNNILLLCFLFAVYSNTTLGQSMDTIFIDLNNLSKQDTTLVIRYNIPKSKCKKGSLNIPIQLESYDSSTVYFIDRFKGNGYFTRENSEQIIIDPKDNIFYENWILHEWLYSDDANKNRKILSLKMNYYNMFYDKKKERKYYSKRLKIVYSYLD